MTEPVGRSSNTSYAQASSDAVSAAPPPRPTGPQVSAGPTQATLQLVRANSLLPKVAPECLDRAVDLAKGAGGLTAAAGLLLASGTAGPVAAFIGASMVFGAVLAQYHNCEVDAAERKAKTP